MPLTVFDGTRDRTRSHEIMTVFDGASELRKHWPSPRHVQDMSKRFPRHVQDVSTTCPPQARRSCARWPRWRPRCASSSASLSTTRRRATGTCGCTRRGTLVRVAEGRQPRDPCTALRAAVLREQTARGFAAHFGETLRGHFGDTSGTLRGHFGHVSQAHFAFPFAFGRTSAQSCTSAHTSRPSTTSSAVRPLRRAREMTRDEPRSHEIARDRTRSHEMARDRTRSHEIARDRTRWHEMTRDHPRSHEIARDRTR